MKIVIPNAEVATLTDDRIELRFHPSFAPGVAGLVDNLRGKRTSQVHVELKPPFRPRTTGERSQNNRLWGHCTDIAQQLIGDDGAPLYEPEDIKEAMCRMAVEEGYPTTLSLDGVEQPKRTRNASVEEVSLVLNVIQRFADTHGLWLTEYDEHGPYRTVAGRPREGSHARADGSRAKEHEVAR